jgi:hypothetical protein
MIREKFIVDVTGLQIAKASAWLEGEAKNYSALQMVI